MNFGIDEGSNQMTGYVPGRVGPRSALCALLSALAVLLVVPGGASAQSLDEGFQAEEIAEGLGGITAMDFGPGGEIYAADREGKVKRVDPDGSVEVVLDITAQTGTWQDRGLTGIAVDSDFENFPYVYLVYTVKPGLFQTDPTVGRVLRYEVSPTGDFVNPHVILGTYTPSAGCPPPSNTIDCMPADRGSHTPDLIRSAPDGTLFVSAGEGQMSEFRALDERSLGGKVLHIDREGRGLADHPFCPADTDLSHVCTKVFAMGFRNPWRITLHPDGNRVFVGDVGQSQFEEVDLTTGGESFGWPCYEGPGRFDGFSSACTDVYAEEGGPNAQKAPWWHYPHSEGVTVVAGPLYRGSTFPPAYHDSLLIADTVNGWIRAVRSDAGAPAEVVAELGSGFTYPVHLQLGPDGESLYVLEHVGGRILKVRFGNENQRPEAVAQATPTASSGLPMDVQFDGTGSSDPDGDDLTFEWDFGDGSAPSSAPAPAHTYVDEGVYEAKLTVTDPAGLSDADTVKIFAGNTPPEVTIEAPDPGFRYVAGQEVALSGHATDAEDGQIPDSGLRWEIKLHHAGHVHSFQDPVGGEASFLPNFDHDADSHYSITLHANDSKGLPSSTSITLDPRTIQLKLDSRPGGVTMSYAGQDVVTPHTRAAGVGFRAQISAPEQIQFNGSTWRFDRWEHGGERSQSFTIPGEDETLIANYAKQNPVDQLIDDLLDLLDGLLNPGQALRLR